MRAVARLRLHASSHLAEEGAECTRLPWLLVKPDGNRARRRLGRPFDGRVDMWWLRKRPGLTIPRYPAP